MKTDTLKDVNQKTFYASSYSHNTLLRHTTTTTTTTPGDMTKVNYECVGKNSD